MHFFKVINPKQILPAGLLSGKQVGRHIYILKRKAFRLPFQSFPKVNNVCRIRRHRRYRLCYRVFRHRRHRQMRGVLFSDVQH